MVELLKPEKESLRESLVQTLVQEVPEEAAKDMSPTHDQQVGNEFTERAVVYAKSRQITRKETNDLTLAEDVPIEPVYEIEVQSEVAPTEKEIVVDLSQSTKEESITMMVKTVQELISEELIHEVQDVTTETSQEQQITVELSQPTREDAKLTAVEPVEEAVSEDIFHEIVQPTEEISTEQEITVELIKPEKELPKESLVQTLEHEVQEEVTRDMSPTQDQVGNEFTERAIVYAKSLQSDKKETNVLTLAQEVPIEPIFEIENSFRTNWNRKRNYR